MDDAELREQAWFDARMAREKEKRDEIAQLRTDLATALRESAELIAQRDTALGALKAERAAHAEIRKALDICSAVHNHNVKLKTSLESTRAELAKAGARVKAVEALCQDADDRGHADVDAAEVLEALRG